MVRLKFCTVGWRDDGAVWTTFNDGSECPATSHDTHHYHVIAHRLGYGDDIASYTLEHEVMHSFVSEWFYDKPSPVLWAIAHGKMLPGKEAAFEEIVAQTGAALDPRQRATHRRPGRTGMRSKRRRWNF